MNYKYAAELIHTKTISKFQNFQTSVLKIYFKFKEQELGHAAADLPITQRMVSCLHCNYYKTPLN